VARVSRAFWFATGVASGVYGVFKVKRALETFTPDGIGARVAAVRLGAQLFADEVSTATRERETELLAELRSGPADERLLAGAEPAAIPAPRHVDRPTDRHRSRESVIDGHR
jgi:hypothetical protein